MREETKTKERKIFDGNGSNRKKLKVKKVVESAIVSSFIFFVVKEN